MATIIQSTDFGVLDVSATITLPADPGVGSILVLVANSLNTLTVPAGWTQRAVFLGDQALYIWDKVSVGAADKSVTVTPSSSTRVNVSIYELNAADIVGFGSVSTATGASNATSIPVNATVVANDTGALLFAVGAMHGWPVAAPATTPVYTNGFSHNRRIATLGTGTTVTGHYVGSKLVTNDATVGTLTIATTATVTNNASFMIAYYRTAGPETVVPLAAVNSTTGWIATGGTPLAVLTDESDTTNLTTGDAPTNVVLDVTLGAMGKPPGAFVVRVRTMRTGATGTLIGKLYNGATLVATAPTLSPPAGAYGDLLVTFAAGDISSLSSAAWTTGLRLTLTVTAV